VLISNPIREFLPPSWWNRAHDYFEYSVDYNTLAASAVAAPRNINIDADSDFLVLSVSRVITTDASGATEQPFAEQLIRVMDSASGANWMNEFTHLDNFAGRMAVDGFGPKWLEVPRLVIRSAAITIELTNLEAAARRIWITFHGCKIFNRIRE